jgi:hypothetical protein
MSTIRFALRGAAAVGTAALALVATPDRAAACGGCFAPNETVTVVTGHRMAVAISPAETTLWDQIEYAGEPEDFVWVLPIQGETLVELASNAFFEAVDGATRITLQGTFPPLTTTCADPCDDGLARGSSFDSAGGSEGPPSVEVFGEAVVGPYETATIGSDDPNALVDWLRTNGYNVPDSILPIIAHYVEQDLNFAVLRLNPNAGVNQMQPVRITTPGMMPVFPLRMVAAGVEGSVGLELYVFGEGRYEAQNFEIVEIDVNDLYYDWDTTRFNYNEAFDAALERGGLRAWVAEYAQPADNYRWQVESYVSFDPETGERLGDASEDWGVVTRSLPSPYLTKLRTDLEAANLNEDLILQASLGDTVENFINVSNERNRPAEPVCPTTCTDPVGPGTIGAPGGVRGDGSARGLCSAALESEGAPFALGGGVAIALGVLAFRRRRR